MCMSRMSWLVLKVLFTFFNMYFRDGEQGKMRGVTDLWGFPPHRPEMVGNSLRIGTRQRGSRDKELSMPFLNLEQGHFNSSALHMYSVTV